MELGIFEIPESKLNDTVPNWSESETLILIEVMILAFVLSHHIFKHNYVWTWYGSR